MPMWVPPPGTDPAETIEALGRDAAAAYQRVEVELVQKILDRTRRGKDIAQQQVTAATVKQLKLDAQKLLSANVPADMAARIVATAQKSGAAAALHDLTKATYSPRVPISRSMAESVTALTADLNSKYAVLNNRILRYPTEVTTGAWLPQGDVYQQVISEVTPSVLLRQASVEDARRAAVKEFLARGVTGFQDKAGRTWTVGTYSEMATRTAVQRAYVDAGVDQMLRNGVNLSQVIVGASGCTKCGQWAGKIISLDGSTGDITVKHATTGQMVTVHVDATYEQLRASMWGHPNCFPGWVPASAPTGISAADSRWFEGELIVIHTAAGRELSVTPNHPILTDEGWVVAGELNEGDNLISYNGDIEKPLTSRPDHESVETPIGEVFEALRESGKVSSVFMPVTPEDFHGDGTVDTEVNVVFADGLLGCDGKPTVLQLPAESKLLLGGMRQGQLLSECASLQIFDVSSDSTDSVVRGTGEPRTLSGRSVGHSDIHGLRTSPNISAATDKPLRERASGDTVTSGEFLDALTGLVLADKIVNVRSRNWSGHVYNLQTHGGWYTANSIIVHNCRCHLASYLPGLTNWSNTTTANPVLEKARDDLRRYERDERKLKQKLAVEDNPLGQKQLGAKIREKQAQIREHVNVHDLPRKQWREQTRFFAGGTRPAPGRAAPTVSNLTDTTTNRGSRGSLTTTSVPSGFLSISSKTRDHIMVGEPEKGLGGHAHDAVVPGKTRFPNDWDEEKIAAAITLTLTEPGEVKSNGTRRSYLKLVDGVLVEVQTRVTKRGIAVVTAFPRQQTQD